MVTTRFVLKEFMQCCLVSDAVERNHLAHMFHEDARLNPDSFLVPFDVGYTLNPWNRDACSAAIRDSLSALETPRPPTTRGAWQPIRTITYMLRDGFKEPSISTRTVSWREIRLRAPAITTDLSLSTTRRVIFNGSIRLAAPAIKVPIRSNSMPRGMFTCSVVYRAAGPHLWKFTQSAGGLSAAWNHDVGSRPYLTDLEVDAAGNAYVGTHTWLESTSVQTQFEISKFDTSGSLDWTLPVSGYTVMNQDMSFRADGNLLVTGFFQSTLNLAGASLSSVGGWDTYVAELDITTVPSSPSWTWATSWGTGGRRYAHRCCRGTGPVG